MLRVPVRQEVRALSASQPKEHLEAVEHTHDVDWAKLTLPETWPDQLNFRNPVSIARLLTHLFRKRQKVVIPRDLPGVEGIPEYVLQEFHNVPNGNYSDVLTRGYITGFDASMLGQMRRVRNHIAERLASYHSVLGFGCASGKTAATIHANGVTDVWGLDPFSYLLRHAARDYPHIRFVQGVMEKLPFPNQRFDGVSACFVFYEVPPLYIRRALGEISRVLKPGGILVIAEPSPIQLRHSLFSMLKKYRWKGGYFHLLARVVHEPFVEAWHRFALADEAAKRALIWQEPVAPAGRPTLDGEALWNAMAS